jgi:exopolysaccharide biosynthesis operon protein EpsL
MTLRANRGWAVALLVCAFGHTPQALALLGDRLEVFVSETITYDSNLIRVSKNTSAFNLLGTDKRSDVYFTTAAGFNFDVPVSRQRFVGGFAINDVRYDRFSDLNYTGHDGRAVWLWQAGNALSGQVGVTQNKTLQSFINFQVRVRDIVTTQTTFANASFLVTPSWQLRAGVDQLKQVHSETSRQFHDIELTGTEGSVTYISRAGNTLGLLVRNEEGHFPNREVVAGSQFDNRYTQRGAHAVLDWRITPASRVSGRVGHVKRDYEQLSQRDFSGTVWRAVYDWTPRARFSVSAIAQRDISVFEDVRASFVLVNGFAVRPAYRISERLRLEGVFDTSKRQYLGDPAVELGATPSRSDRLNTLGVTLTWQALRNVSVIASAVHERRTSNVALADYDATVLFLRGRIGF